MQEETFYKVNVIDITKRKRIIKDNLKKKISHKETFKIKDKFKPCPIIWLDINVPVYHLNNGRTRDAQRSYVIDNGHKPNYFEKALENTERQMIAGNSEQLCQIMQDYLDAGVSEFILPNFNLGSSLDQQIEAYDQFMEEVAKNFK